MCAATTGSIIPMGVSIIPMDTHIWELARVVCEMPYDDVCRTSVFKKVTQLYWQGGGKDGGSVRYSLQSTTLAGSEQAIQRMREHVSNCHGVHYSNELQAFVFASFEDLFNGTLSLLRAAASGGNGDDRHDRGSGSGVVENERLAVFEAFMRCASNVVDVMELVEMMEELL